MYRVSSASMWTKPLRWRRQPECAAQGLTVHETIYSCPMDLDSRDWLIVIGALLIVGVLLDAWRRYRNDRRNPIRLASKSMGPGGGFARDEPDPASAELPGGGARVVVREPDQVRLQRPSPSAAPRRKEPRMEPKVEASLPSVPEPMPLQPVTEDAAPSPDEPHPQVSPAQTDVVPAAPAPAVPAEPALAAPAPAVLSPTIAPADSRPGAVPMPERDVLFVRVVSRGDGAFGGVDLARIFKECDVRVCPDRVFQRTELARGEGAVQFTVFNGTAQGVFESALDESFTTRGLGFLMRLGEPQKPLEAFDCMLETARAVAKYCDGELRDDTNSVFTQQTGEHCRERIRDFALRTRARR